MHKTNMIKDDGFYILLIVALSLVRALWHPETGAVKLSCQFQQTLEDTTLQPTVQTAVYMMQTGNVLWCPTQSAILWTPVEGESC